MFSLSTHAFSRRKGDKLPNSLCDEFLAVSYSVMMLTTFSNTLMDVVDYPMRVDELVAPAPGGAIPKGQAGGVSNAGLKTVDRVRSVFPETWLWSNLSVGFVGHTLLLIWPSVFIMPALFVIPLLTLCYMYIILCFGGLA